MLLVQLVQNGEEKVVTSVTSVTIAAKEQGLVVSLTLEGNDEVEQHSLLVAPNDSVTVVQHP